MRKFNITLGDLEIKFYNNKGNEEFEENEPAKLHRFRILINGKEDQNITEIHIPIINHNSKENFEILLKRRV